jgi:hypothetical protein
VVIADIFRPIRVVHYTLSFLDVICEGSLESSLVAVHKDTVTMFRPRSVLALIIPNNKVLYKAFRNAGNPLRIARSIRKEIFTIAVALTFAKGTLVPIKYQIY